MLHWTRSLLKIEQRNKVAAGADTLPLETIKKKLLAGAVTALLPSLANFLASLMVLLACASLSAAKTINLFELDAMVAAPLY
ncbi:MAG: hypothetical protein HWD59_14995 [Coxiellaceae bacterium]|nr:MAG: hypothetical protein HWD59_14995 [Coxiellaceae bacterium]